VHAQKGATAASAAPTRTPAVRAARIAGLALVDPLYRRVKRSRAAALLDAPLLRRLRYRVVPGMGPREVLDVIEILERGGAPAWLVGGWGVDALVGRQTRKHPDVDVAVERRDLDQALESLEAAGFAVVQREILPNWMPTMIVLRDAKRRWIELMVVDVPGPPPEDDGRPEGMRFRYTDASFTTGSLNGRRVRCLAAGTQLLFHTGYPPRDSDRHDVSLLTRTFALPTPDAYA